jgi:predicted NUDIX family NTP pyrophosphohydrolase
MPAASAGILLYRQRATGPEVLLGHPGGPFWQRRDAGAWMLPKGEIATGEDAECAARREFAEELGVPPVGTLQPLGRIRQRGGKWVDGFALEGDFDPAALRSAMFKIEWPPRSGRRACFPELDRVAWFTLPEARDHMLASQVEFLGRLEALLVRDQRS